jgi:hypothetical protein
MTMADEIKRLHYFDHQFLRAPDFTDEQEYHLGMRRRHQRLLHTWGIAEGLGLSFASGASRVTVGEGSAVDGEGREIVLPEDTQSADLSGFSGKTVFITIAYDEQETDATSETGVTGNTRWTETPLVEVGEDPPDDPSLNLIVGRVSVGADGKITGTDGGADPNLRRSAGVVGGDLEVRSLTLSDPGVVPAGWPRMRLGAPGRADLLANLRVNGNIEATATVDGRDVSADGTKLDQHVASTANPHGTTAAQIGALASVDGVSNPGGNIDLVPGNAVTITPDDANNRVTIGEGHSARGDNPHGTTAAQIGALASVDGVSNPGGNIDLVPGNAVTITPDDANNQVTIGEGHSARGDNPHGTTAAQIGAVPLGTTQLSSTLGLRSAVGTNSPVLTLWHGNPTAIWGLLSIVSSSLGSWSGASAAAVAGVSNLPNVPGVLAMTNQGGTNALRVDGPSQFNGAKTGYVVDVFVNASGDRLHTGDVVKLRGTPTVAYAGMLNRIPLAEVTLADSADDSLVIGVVDGEAIPLPDEPDQRVEAEDPTFVQNGGRLHVVTLGCFSHCKVDASEAPIRVGDLLTTSAKPGHAKKATEPRLGSILGKALEPLEQGVGYIAVFVNIH